MASSSRQIPPISIIRAFWDLQNCPADQVYRVANGLQNLVLQIIPNAQLRITAYADKHQVKEATRKACLDAGVTLIDIPVGEGNAGDRVIICDMYAFALENPPPAYVMLISGDGDFVRSIKGLHNLGYTTMVVCRNRASKELKAAGDYHFYWENLCNLNILVGPSGQQNSLRLGSHPRVQINLSGSLGIFWDRETCPLPTNVGHIYANSSMKQSLIRDTGITPATIYRAYMEKKHFPPDNVVKGIEYIATSKSKFQKPDHLENVMSSDIYNFAIGNRPPSTIVVLTGNHNFSGMIRFLRNWGYRMIVFVPYSGITLLEDSATIVSLYVLPKSKPCLQWRAR